MSFSIDIISDVVCPWCYIGKRHLEQALELYREREPGAPQAQVHWHPFQLNPDLPRQGMPRQEYIARKFGGAARAKDIYARVSEAGQRAGIEFAFDAINVQPNTLQAHRLIYLAARHGIQDALVEALFRGYFLEQRDLTRDETLAELGERAGLAHDQAAAYLASDLDTDLIKEAEEGARRIGVQGVPFFIFNRALGASGAQPPEVLLDAMLRAQRSGEAESRS